MNDLKHKERHQQLHQALDEPIADYLEVHKDKKISDTTVMELISWSFKQCSEATND